MLFRSSAAVPTYVGGIMAFAWASDTAAYRQIKLSTLRQRWTAAGISTRYYTPELHKAAFALPQYLIQAISSAQQP